MIEQTQIDKNPALEQIQSKGYSQKYINLINTVEDKCIARITIPEGIEKPISVEAGRRPGDILI
ncbi:MAG: hypothetical protein HQK65_03905 [Desulfamplus sp.]|nr:hypothetical protein [Desulfamplus sp.]